MGQRGENTYGIEINNINLSISQNRNADDTMIILNGIENKRFERF